MEIGQSVRGTTKYEEQEVDASAESSWERMVREQKVRMQQTVETYNDLLAQISRATLPTLSGSEKQVKWAQSIRATAQACMQRVYKPGRSFTGLSASTANTEAAFREMRQMIAQLNTIEAQWWIQNRSRWGA